MVGTTHTSNIRLGRALVGYGVDVEVIFPVAKMELCSKVCCNYLLLGDVRPTCDKND